MFKFDREEYNRRVAWFRQDRFGMFIHWGLYAIPARGEWVRSQERISVEAYQPYFDEFNPVDYDPKKWAKLAKEAGMKYAVLMGVPVVMVMLVLMLMLMIVVMLMLMFMVVVVVMFVMIVVMVMLVFVVMIVVAVNMIGRHVHMGAHHAVFELFLDVQVEGVAQIELGQIALEGFRIAARVEQRAHGHVSADAGKAVKIQDLHFSSSL